MAPTLPTAQEAVAVPVAGAAEAIERQAQRKSRLNAGFLVESCQGAKDTESLSRSGSGRGSMAPALARSKGLWRPWAMARSCSEKA